MPSKYGINYTIVNGKAIIAADAARRLPKIEIRNYTTSRNLDYILRVLGNEVPKMPQTQAAFEALYNRGLQGSITFTNAPGVVGDMSTTLQPGQSGPNAIIDQPGNIRDFAMTISVTNVQKLASSFESARKGEITGPGLTAADVAQLRGRDSTLDALIYLFGHEVGGHIGKAGLVDPREHNNPTTFTDFYDDPVYRTGWSDAYAAGVGGYRAFKRSDGSIYYSYSGNLVGSDIRDYWGTFARQQYGGGKRTLSQTTGLNLSPVIYPENEVDLSTDPSLASSQIGAILGSSLARFVGGGYFESLVASPVLAALGQNIAEFISAGGVGANAATARGAYEKSFGDFSQDLKTQLQGAAIGTISSFLALELGNSLGIKGFGGELVTTGASSVFSQVLNNAAAIASTPAGQAAPSLFAGLDGKGLFGKDLVGQGSNIGLVNSAFASFFGSKLGALILAPNNTEGAVLSSIGASLGAWAFGAGAASAGTIGSVGAAIAGAFGNLGNFVAPFVGSLVGFLLGSLIGRIFGKKKPRIPTASAEAILSIGSREWSLGQIASANGGSREAVTEAAKLTADTINGVLALASGTRGKVLSAVQLVEKIGHSGQTIYLDRVTNGYATRLYSGTDLSAAVEKGSVDGIKSTQVYGGDLFVKRAIARSQASNMVELMGDIQTATDYGTYLANRNDINSLITQSPTSEFAITWAITLQRASELGLTEFQASDLQGGLGGFLSSLGFGTATGVGEVGLGYESVRLSDEGGALRITTNDGSAPFSLFSWSNNVGNPAQSLLIQNFASATGYTPWTGQATSGNDIWIASSGGPVTMEDGSYENQGYWYYDYGMNDYYYQDNYVYVSGGDDIFVGSGYGDTLLGQQGGDWLDGGGGDDVVDGGADNDVVLGGSGNDRLLGSGGDDYIAGGDGDDYFYDAARTWGLYGGDGNDILVGGGGSDALYGEAGNDVFLIDQDGGGTWDAINGQDGTDTVSYERFSSGVSVDFNVLGGWSWDPTAKYIYGDSIANVENVTGTAFQDTIVGDEKNNTLRGLDGNDQLYGSSGDDILDGGLGADYLDGGAGSDTASYERAIQGVVISLSDQIYSNGDAEGDSMSSIENIRGSSYADDLTGDAGANVLTGLGGDDFFGMSAGSDAIDGGDGFDTLDASLSESAVTVYFDPGSYDPYYGYYTPGAGFIASSSTFGTTSLNSVEGFIGSDYADFLSGSDADEVFRGGAGNDYLSGGEGSDTYIYQEGDGVDTITDSASAANSIVIDQPNFKWGDIFIQGANYQVQNGSLSIGIRGSSAIMNVGYNFNYTNSGSQAGNHSHVIKTISLAGSEIDISQIDWTPDETYASFSQTIYGGQNLSDLIFAMDGDDTIYTSGSEYGYETRGNVVYGGAGNDVIYSSAGDDQFVFERGNGVDTLTDWGGDDTVVMGPGVSEDDVIFEVVNTYGGSGDYGSSADLYIGLRDLTNPGLSASQVADRIRIVGGGTKSVGVNSGAEMLNTIEHVRVAGQEVDLTKANINWTTSYYYDGGYYPIAIDLDGDGIELRSVEGSRITTIEADGTVTRMGWLGQDDGFLALDRDGNGVIDRISEISFIGDKDGAKTDLEGLAAYDSNSDGKLDASDQRWSEFKVWRDINQDGFGSKKELVGLDEAGVSSISLKGQLTGFTAADGPDNTVVATTDIVWKDVSRTGSAYDVMLARLQVRTDNAAEKLANLAVQSQGKKADDVEATLRGIQMLTAEEAAAIKEKKSKHINDGESGRFYRVEDLLKDGSAKLEGGLYSIDPKLARVAVDSDRKSDLLDRYRDSEWTKLGSAKPGKADMRGAEAPFKKVELSDAQKAVIADARKVVADRKASEAEKAAARATVEEADAVLHPAPTPPTAEELEKLKKKDKFQLLGGATDASVDLKKQIDPRLFQQEPIGNSASIRTMDEEQLPNHGEMLAGEEEAQMSASDQSSAAHGLNRTEQVLNDGDRRSQDVKEDAYGVVIRAANARLVQALASFGDTPAMMANYQGLNVANDPQAAWLSVDAMPSVQRLAAIR